MNFELSKKDIEMIAAQVLQSVSVLAPMQNILQTRINSLAEVAVDERLADIIARMTIGEMVEAEISSMLRKEKGAALPQVVRGILENDAVLQNHIYKVIVQESRNLRQRELKALEDNDEQGN